MQLPIFLLLFTISDIVIQSLPYLPPLLLHLSSLSLQLRYPLSLCHFSSSSPFFATAILSHPYATAILSPPYSTAILSPPYATAILSPPYATAILYISLCHYISSILSDNILLYAIICIIPSIFRVQNGSPGSTRFYGPVH